MYRMKSKLTVELIHGKEPDDCFIKLGGLGNSPSWDEYVGSFKKPWQKRFKVLRKYIEEHHMIGVCGDEQQDFYWKFSDGEMISFSMRAWGDLMQAIVGKKEGYMAYYMRMAEGYTQEPTDRILSIKVNEAGDIVLVRENGTYTLSQTTTPYAE